MESSTEHNYDLSEFRVMTIEDTHKIAIMNLMNGIIAEPLLEELSDTKTVVYKLGQLIQLFDESFITSGIDMKDKLKLPDFETMDESVILNLSIHIRNWLVSYYNADSLIGNQLVVSSVISQLFLISRLRIA